MSHNWTSVDPDFGAEHINDVATDGAGTWVAVGSGGVGSVSVDDGATWNAITGTPFGTSNMRGVAYGNGYWVAVGGAVAYGNSTWVAVGNIGGAYILYSATDPTATWTSRSITGTGAIASTGSDPTTGWTARTVSDAPGHSQVDPTFGTDMDVAYGNGRFLVVGQTDIATSTNGTAWTNYGEIANGGADDGYIFNSLVSVAYGSGVWVISGTSQSSVVSGNPGTGAAYNDDVTDMWGWTVINLTNGAPYCLAYGDLFLAIDGGGDVIASADATSWASDNSTFFTATPFWPYEYGGGLGYGNGVWVAGGDTADAGPLIVGSLPYVLQYRSELDGDLISSVSISAQATQMRRTPSGQHVFIGQGTGTLERYDRALTLEDTVTVTGFFPCDDWNVDDAYWLFRIDGNVLKGYDETGSEQWSKDLNALRGYRFPSRALSGGTGQQVFTGRTSGNGAAADDYLRVVGYIGDVDWTTAGTEACLIIVRRSDGRIEAVKRYGGGASDAAQAIAVDRFGDCLYLVGAATGTSFEDETISGLSGWLMRVPAGLI